jgi:hypothetical protein
LQDLLPETIVLFKGNAALQQKLYSCCAAIFYSCRHPLDSGDTIPVGSDACELPVDRGGDMGRQILSGGRFVPAYAFAFATFDFAQNRDPVPPQDSGFQIDEETVRAAEHGAAGFGRTAGFRNQFLKFPDHGAALGGQIVEQRLEIGVFGVLRRLAIPFVAVLRNPDQVVQGIDDLCLIHGPLPDASSCTGQP